MPASPSSLEARRREYEFDYEKHRQCSQCELSVADASHQAASAAQSFRIYEEEYVSQGESREHTARPFKAFARDRRMKSVAYYAVSSPQHPADECRKRFSKVFEPVLHPGYGPVVESAEYAQHESKQYKRPVVSERKRVLDIKAEYRSESQNVCNYEVTCRTCSHCGKKDLSRKVSVELFKAEYGSGERSSECGREACSRSACYKKALLGEQAMAGPGHTLADHRAELYARPLPAKRKSASYRQCASRHLAGNHAPPAHVLLSS